MSDYGVKIGIKPGRYWDKKREYLSLKFSQRYMIGILNTIHLLGFFVTQKDNQIVKINKIP